MASKLWQDFWQKFCGFNNALLLLCIQGSSKLHNARRKSMNKQNGTLGTLSNLYINIFSKLVQNSTEIFPFRQMNSRSYSTLIGMKLLAGDSGWKMSNPPQFNPLDKKLCRLCSENRPAILFALKPIVVSSNFVTSIMLLQKGGIFFPVS